MNESTAILVGAGGFGRELICWARDAHQAGKFPRLAGYINDDPASLSGFDYELPYLGTIQGYQPSKEVQLLIGLGDPQGKKKIVELLVERGGVFATLIHPSTVVASSAKLGQGVILCPHSLISADAEVGNFVTINALSSVGHDVSVGDFTTLSAHVDITGGVVVGGEVFFGSGAKVVPRIKIGDRAKIGVGAIVMRSVPADATMFAAPARKF